MPASPRPDVPSREPDLLTMSGEALWMEWGDTSRRHSQRSIMDDHAEWRDRIVKQAAEAARASVPSGVLDDATCAKIVRGEVSGPAEHLAGWSDAAVVQTYDFGARCARAAFALGASVDGRAAQREGWDAAVAMVFGHSCCVARHGLCREDFDAARDRRWPVPRAEVSVTLACGDVVKRTSTKVERWRGDACYAHADIGDAEMVLDDTDTLGDQKAVERLAASAGVDGGSP